MFGDIFSVSPSQLDEVSKHFTINLVALGQLLVAKGVITEDEWTEAIIQATALVDQKWQERKEKQQAEFEKEHPGLSLMKQLFGDDIGELFPGQPPS